MERVILLLFLIVSSTGTILGTNINDSLYSALEKSIKEADQFIANKEYYISKLRKKSAINDKDLETQYDDNNKLYKEFIKYKSDSALHYAKINLELATKLDDPNLVTMSTLQMALIYSQIGYHIEASKMLSTIRSESLSGNLLIEYYKVCGYLHDHYGLSNANYSQFKISDLYRDSLLLILPKESFEYSLIKAEKDLYSQRQEDAEKGLLKLFDTTSDEDPERAYIAFLLSELYKYQSNSKLQRRYLMISAIADIHNVIKDNASLQSLALLYHKEGNIDMAYKYMKIAIDDAIFANIRYRASEGLAFYPIINAAYQNKVQNQKTELQKYLILISILSLFFILAVVYVYKQMKRLSKIRKELYQTNLKLTGLNVQMQNRNEELSDLNIQLSESNHIKEEYIAQFFDMCSSYIYKLDDFKKELNAKAKNRQLEELYKILKSSDLIDKEFDELYTNFDTIFLNLYPNFIKDFNELLIEEERVIPKSEKSLNTELRIFALIRLGITDSVKIASFLRYSLSTIYNYRTKARNKAVTSRDEFELMVMKIGK